MSESEPAAVRVLCIDAAADAIAARLEPNGFDVAVAESAEAGLERLETEPVDCIVSEHRLPGMDGLAFLRAVRATHAELPFVLHTDAGDEALASAAIAAGVTDYVPKDSGGALARRLERVVGAARTGRTLGADAHERTVDALRLKQRAMDEAPVGITISDPTQPDNPLIYVNDAFERLTGYPKAETLGRNCRYLQGPESDPAAIAEMREAVDERRPTSVELLNYRKDGTPFWNKVDIAPLFDADGSITHFVGFQTDITDRKRAEFDAERKATALAAERRSLERLLDRINGLVHQTTQALVTAETREEVEQAVCERVTAVAPYTLAWIGEPDLAAKTLAPVAWAGRDFDLEGSIDLDDEAVAGTAVARAVETQRTQLEAHPDVPRAAVDGEPKGADTPSDAGAIDPGIDGAGLRADAADRSGSRAGSATDPNAGSNHDTDADHGTGGSGTGRSGGDAAGATAAIPIAYQDTVYGVLSVHTDDPDVLDDRELLVLEALCKATATALNALESRRILTADNVIELEFEIDDDALFFAAVSARADCRLEHAGSVYRSDGSLTVFATATGAPPDRVADAVETCPEVGDATLVTEREDACLFELTIDRPSITSILADHGAATRSITAEGGICRLCAELPQESNARAVVEALEKRYDGTELVAYHERERPARTAQEFIADIEDRLTERQLTALRMAYLGGFFEWPRPTSGEELSESMGISRSTYHQHLRAAERKLVEVFFER